MLEKTTSKWLPIPWFIVLTIGIFIFSKLVSGWMTDWMMKKPITPIGVPVLATPAKEVKRESMIPVPISTKTIHAYPPAIKGHLNLPQAVQDNPAAQVVAASRVESDDHPHTITTVMDAESGAVQTFDRRDPLPWLDPNTHGRIGIYYGIKQGTPTVRLQAHQELLQIKSAHVGVIGSLDMPVGVPTGMDYYAGVGVWANW